MDYVVKIRGEYDVSKITVLGNLSPYLTKPHSLNNLGILSTKKYLWNYIEIWPKGSKKCSRKCQPPLRETEGVQDHHMGFNPFLPIDSFWCLCSKDGFSKTWQQLSQYFQKSSSATDVSS